MNRAHIVVGASIGILGLGAGPARAAIVSATPGTIVLATPQIAVSGSTFGPQFAFAWNERQSVSVTALAVDNIGSTGNSTNAATPGLVTGVVDVHMIHKEPHWPLGTGSLQGTVTFNNPVIGVIWTAPGLNASDSVCAAGTAYSTSSSRGISVGAEWVVVSGSTVSFDLTHGNFPTATYSEIRVLTAAPAPGTAAMLAAGGVLTLGRRRPAWATRRTTRSGGRSSTLPA